MRHGFIKTAAITPTIRVADVEYNAGEIIRLMKEANAQGAKLIVFPELCLTGYTCGDLFLQDTLLESAKEQLFCVAEETEDLDALIVVGLPWKKDGKLYNVAAVLSQGEILGMVPKTNIPNYGEFGELRYFAPGNSEAEDIWLEWGSEDGSIVPFGTDILFRCVELPDLVVAAEICEDLWVPAPPSVRHALAGATLIVNSSASDETAGKDAYRERLVEGHSARLVCGYVCANAGEGESTQDLVFGGHNLIAENGTMLAASARFQNETVYGDIDVARLMGERRRMNLSFGGGCDGAGYLECSFHLKKEDTPLCRKVEASPFIPVDPLVRSKRCEEILTIQAMGLKKRLHHTNCKHPVVGISGGLDSTLAILVMVKACDMLNIPRENIISVTMPCFGTTGRTYNNACELTRRLGATLREVDIK